MLLLFENAPQVRTIIIVLRKFWQVTTHHILLFHTAILPFYASGPAVQKNPTSAWTAVVPLPSNTGAHFIHTSTITDQPTVLKTVITWSSNSAHVTAHDAHAHIQCRAMTQVRCRWHLRPVHMGFMADRVALGQVYIPEPCFSPVLSHQCSVLTIHASPIDAT
jgi:hypothetical protein